MSTEKRSNQDPKAEADPASEASELEENAMLETTTDSDESEKAEEALRDAFAPVEDPESGLPAQEPSRLGRWLRLALRWITGAVVVFGLGVLATFLTLVQPLRTQNQNLQAELQTSRQELQDTQADLESLDPLEQDYEQAQISLALLDVRQDVTAAQLALAQDDPLAVRAALSGTDAKLQTLRSRLAGSAADSVQGMRNRLTLVLDEFEDDPFAAQNDLEVLASNLDTLHEALFGE